MNFKIDRDLLIKIAVGIAGVVLVVATLQFVINLAMQLVPFALLVVALYLGYNWLRSSDNNPLQSILGQGDERQAPEQEAAQTKRPSKRRTRTSSTQQAQTPHAPETQNDATSSTFEQVAGAAQVARTVAEQIYERRIKPQVQEAEPAETVQGEATPPAPAETEAERDQQAVPAKPATSIPVTHDEPPQAVADTTDTAAQSDDQPRTVIDPKTGLEQPNIERLIEKENEKPEVNDDVMAQLEARKKRLLGGEQSD